MVIAGCLNQARNIFEKFDDILYGPAPEELVVETHGAIKKLLASQECEAFMSKGSKDDQDAVKASDDFIRKITEAVTPIIPITLRNKSLDGAYFRTALQLLAAAEFIFKQYEQDVRIHANPAGVVGMCNNMHGDMKRAAVYNDALSPVDDFLKEMKAQYNTSLGLGSSFARDSAIQGSRRGRRRRGRGAFRGSRYQWPAYTRGQGLAQPQGVNNPERSTFYDGVQPVASNPASMRGPGPCYAYPSGNCNRGRACRFTH